MPASNKKRASKKVSPRSKIAPKAKAHNKKSSFKAKVKSRAPGGSAKSAAKAVTKTATKIATKIATKSLKKGAPKSVKKPVTGKKFVKKKISLRQGQASKAKIVKKTITSKGAKGANLVVEKEKKQPAPVRVGGFPDQLCDTALRILNERQAEEIVTVSLAGRSSMADYLIIASGRAARQVAAIADYLREAFMKAGVRQVRVEGLPEGNWVLVDAGDIIVHLFRPEVRRYYKLEDIWTNDKVASKEDPVLDTP